MSVHISCTINTYNRPVKWASSPHSGLSDWARLAGAAMLSHPVKGCKTNRPHATKMARAR